MTNVAATCAVIHPESFREKPRLSSLLRKKSVTRRDSPKNQRNQETYIPDQNRTHRSVHYVIEFQMEEQKRIKGDR